MDIYAANYVFRKDTFSMVQLRVLEILEDMGQTEHWLFKQMNMQNFRHFQNIIENRTSSIRFDTLIKLSQILEVPVGELFKQSEHDEAYPKK